MGIGFLVMYLSVDFPSLLASGIIIGLGNGLSTGLIMAISGDYAPKDQRRGPFLSLFKLIYGLGQMFGPSMTGIASEYFGVEGGALLTVIVCVFGIIWGYINIIEKEIKNPRKAGFFISKRINRIVADAEQYALMMLFGLGFGLLLLFVVVGVALTIGYLYV